MHTIPSMQCQCTQRPPSLYLCMCAYRSSTQSSCTQFPLWERPRVYLDGVNTASTSCHNLLHRVSRVDNTWRPSTLASHKGRTGRCRRPAADVDQLASRQSMLLNIVYASIIRVNSNIQTWTIDLWALTPLHVHQRLITASWLAFSLSHCHKNSENPRTSCENTSTEWQQKIFPAQ